MKLTNDIMEELMQRIGKCETTADFNLVSFREYLGRRLTPQPVGDVVNNLYGVDEMLAEITRLRGLIGELIPFISTVVDNGYQDTSAGTRMSTKCKACDTVYYSIASNKSTEIWECTNPDCPAGRAREVAG